MAIFRTLATFFRKRRPASHRYYDAIPEPLSQILAEARAQAKVRSKRESATTSAGGCTSSH